MARAILIDQSDNVATCITDAAEGETVVCFGTGDGCEVVAREPIASGHKIALAPIAETAPVIKYGEPIGTALADILAGGWVHSHNCGEVYRAGKERGAS